MAQPGPPVPPAPSAQPPSTGTAPGSATPPATTAPPAGTPVPPPTARPGVPPPVYPYPYPYGSAYPYGYPPPAGSAYPYPPPGGSAYPPGYAPPAGSAYPYPYPYYPPYYYQPGGTAQRPPPPPPPPGRRLHNGFFLQMTPGVIMHRGNLSLEGTSADASTRGLGFGWDIAIGATITGGFVLAGALGSHDTNASLTNNNTGSSAGETDLDYTTLSALGAWYPDPTKGLNVQAGVGFARMNLERLRVGPVLNAAGQRVSSDVNDLTGAGFTLGLGYETFVDNEWSIGLLLKLEAAILSQDSDPKVAATMFTPSLRLAFTYH